MSESEDKSESAEGGRPSVLSLNIREKNALYAAYIPQLKNGGIFIPTARAHHLGDEVFMLVSLPDEAAKIPVSGRVVWMTPADAQGKRAQGVGIQFSSDEAGRSAKKKIEGLLAGMLDSSKITHTF
ncbi:MAG: PilZ domain-containing protein [Burkholderiales bacterium]